MTPQAVRTGGLPVPAAAGLSHRRRGADGTRQVAFPLCHRELSGRGGRSLSGFVPGSAGTLG